MIKQIRTTTLFSMVLLTASMPVLASQEAAAPSNQPAEQSANHEVNIPLAALPIQENAVAAPVAPDVQIAIEQRADQDAQAHRINFRNRATYVGLTSTIAGMVTGVVADSAVGHQIIDEPSETMIAIWSYYLLATAFFHFRDSCRPYQRVDEQPLNNERFGLIPRIVEGSLLPIIMTLVMLPISVDIQAGGGALGTGLAFATVPAEVITLFTLLHCYFRHYPR